MTRDQLFDALSALSAMQLDAVVYKLAVPRAILPGPSTPRTTVVVEALHWAEQHGRLNDDYYLSDTKQVSPFIPPLCAREPLNGAVRPRNFTLMLLGREPQKTRPWILLLFSVYPVSVAPSLTPSAMRSQVRSCSNQPTHRAPECATL